MLSHRRNGRRFGAFVAIAVGLAFATLAVPQAPVVAQELAPARIAVLEMRRIEAEALAWKDLRTKFQQANERILGELRGIQEGLEQEGQELQQQQAILAPEAFEERRQAFEQRLQGINQQAAQRRQALEKALFEARTQIIDQIQQIVLDISEEQGLNLIMDRSNADPTIVLAKPEIEITQEVIRRLDARITSVQFSVPAAAQ
jgi:Skp family chaperone for outer membrane proteins